MDKYMALFYILFADFMCLLNGAILCSIDWWKLLPCQIYFLISLLSPELVVSIGFWAMLCDRCHYVDQFLFKIGFIGSIYTNVASTIALFKLIDSPCVTFTTETDPRQAKFVWFVFLFINSLCRLGIFLLLFLQCTRRLYYKHKQQEVKNLEQELEGA